MFKTRTVDVLGVKYRIVYQKHVLDANDKLVDGAIEYYKKKIFLTSTLDKYDMAKTLLHEMAHAYARELGGISGEDVENVTIDGISNCFFSFLAHNKTLAREILRLI